MLNHNIFWINLNFSISWQLGFQFPGTLGMEKIVNLHNDVMVFMVFVLVFISWMIICIVYLFRSKNAYTLRFSFQHHTMLEQIWTLIPAVILFFIAGPSFTLLYGLSYKFSSLASTGIGTLYFDISVLVPWILIGVGIVAAAGLLIWNRRWKSGKNDGNKLSPHIAYCLGKSIFPSNYPKIIRGVNAFYFSDNDFLNVYEKSITDQHLVALKQMSPYRAKTIFIRNILKLAAQSGFVHLTPAVIELYVNKIVSEYEGKFLKGSDKFWYSLDIMRESIWLAQKNSQEIGRPDADIPDPFPYIHIYEVFFYHYVSIKLKLYKPCTFFFCLSDTNKHDDVFQNFYLIRETKLWWPLEPLFFWRFQKSNFGKFFPRAMN